jgi:hypothetical protein
MTQNLTINIVPIHQKASQEEDLVSFLFEIRLNAKIHFQNPPMYLTPIILTKGTQKIISLSLIQIFQEKGKQKAILNSNSKLQIHNYPTKAQGHQELHLDNWQQILLSSLLYTNP